MPDLFKEGKPSVDAIPAAPKERDPILPPLKRESKTPDRTAEISIPLPEEDERFTEYTTDELFAALLRRIKREKARIMLQAGYQQFQEIARRVTPAYAVDVALHQLREISSGQVRAAYSLEHETGNPLEEGPPI
jgi:hypothetical protein